VSVSYSGLCLLQHVARTYTTFSHINFHTQTHLQAMGSLSARLYGFIIPVVQFGADITRPEHVYLLEDSLNLWASMLQWAPQVTGELLSLFRLALPLLSRIDETLKTSLAITRSYMLLCPSELVQSFGQPLVAACCGMLPEVSMKAAVMVCEIIETVLVALPETGSGLFLPLCLHVFEAITLKPPVPIVTVSYLGVILRWMMVSDFVV
jgi:hypothetical protein